LDTRSSMSMIGDLNRFQQYEMGQAMSVAAANPAGGLAGAGVGLGMGMAMAGQMAPGAPAPAQGSPTPPPVPQGSMWHVAAQGQSSGPFSVAQVQEGIASGQMSAVTLVWTAGMGAWEQAGNVPALAGLFAAVPPPVPGS
jgi:membrane protease subunit (stomatin/prohibitin family)